MRRAKQVDERWDVDVWYVSAEHDSRAVVRVVAVRCLLAGAASAARVAIVDLCDVNVWNVSPEHDTHVRSVRKLPCDATFWPAPQVLRASQVLDLCDIDVWNVSPEHDAHVRSFE